MDHAAPADPDTVNVHSSGTVEYASYTTEADEDPYDPSCWHDTFNNKCTAHIPLPRK